MTAQQHVPIRGFQMKPFRSPEEMLDAHEAMFGPAGGALAAAAKGAA
jgi:hypothetical protein